MPKAKLWWKVVTPILVLFLLAGVGASSAAEVPHFAQRDQAWNEHPLGHALEGQTIGDYGCGVSAAAMVLAYYGYATTPQALNDALKQNKGFSGSLLVWKADPWQKATNGFIKGVADYRTWHKDWQHRQDILRENVEVGRPVIVFLSGAHYVVVTRYDSAEEEFYINDPWLGADKGLDIPFEDNSKGASLSSITQMVILYPQAELPPTVGWPSIREKYIETGGEAGVLGPSLQADEEYIFPGNLKGRVQRFQSGSIYTYSQDGGTSWQTFWLTPAMAENYDRLRSELGLPTTDAYSVVVRGAVEAVRADFTQGSLIHYLGAPAPDVILADAGFKAEYFANPELEGPPVLVRYEPDILFAWGDHAPAPQLPADGFSVRWTGSLQIAVPGPRVFHVIADDGVRLNVDGEPILDAWNPQSTEHHRALKFLWRGQHQVTLEYFDAQSAASVFWAITLPLIEPAFAEEEALGSFDTLPEKAPPLAGSTAPEFDPNHVVCNNHFAVDRPVSAQEVQRLFEAADTDLKDYRDPANDMLASEIIARTIEDNIIQDRYRLSPRFLLVKMEVESNTVWGKDRHALDAPVHLKDEEVGKIVDWLLFYGWPDDPAKVDLTKKGFTNQVSNAVRILSSDFADLLEDGKGRNRWAVGVPYPEPIDGQQVTPANAATAALYIYTPHVEPDKKNIHWAWYHYIGDTSCDDTIAAPVLSARPLLPLFFDLVLPPETAHLRIEVQNTGTTTWEPAQEIELRRVWKDVVSPVVESYPLPHRVPPGETVAWDIELNTGGSQFTALRFRLYEDSAPFGPEIGAVVITLPEQLKDQEQRIREAIERKLEEWQQRAEEEVDRKVEEFRAWLLELIQRELERQTKRWLDEVCGGSAMLLLGSVLLVAQHRWRRRH